jgi:hypothetical protein
MDDFENTYLYASLLKAMDDYDEYDPEFIRKMTEDWERIMAEMMEDKHGNSKESDRYNKDG